MPLTRVPRSAPIDHRQFHKLLRDWIAGNPTDTAGPRDIDARTVWVHVQRDGRLYGLHVDTPARAAAAYVDLANRYGDDLTWSIVANQRGNLNAVAAGPQKVRPESFYFYLLEPEPGRSREDGGRTKTLADARDFLEPWVGTLVQPVEELGGQGHVYRFIGMPGIAPSNFPSLRIFSRRPVTDTSEITSISVTIERRSRDTDAQDRSSRAFFGADFRTLRRELGARFPVVSPDDPEADTQITMRDVARTEAFIADVLARRETVSQTTALTPRSEVDVLTGGAEFQRQAARTGRGPRLDPEQLQLRLKAMAESGEKGEALFRKWLLSTGHEEGVDFQWRSRHYALDPYDFYVYRPRWKDAAGPVYIDVKATTDAHLRSFYISMGEVVFAAGRQNYLIAGISGVNTESPVLTLLDQVSERAKDVIAAIEYLPPWAWVANLIVDASHLTRRLSLTIPML